MSEEQQNEHAAKEQQSVESPLENPRHTDQPRHQLLESNGEVATEEATVPVAETNIKNRLGFFAKILAAFEESWAEVRVNKVRILFSLFGVLIAVAALATVVGFGSILSKTLAEQNERYGGREATLTLSAYSDKISKEDYFLKIEELKTRYSLTAATRIGYGTLRVQFVDGVTEVPTQLFDQQYGETRRVVLKEGHWFSDKDVNRLAPAIIVNQAFWERLGSPSLNGNPTVDLLGENAGTAVIVAVTPSFGEWDTQPEAMMLYDHYRFNTWEEGQFPEYQFWVKPEISDQLMILMNQEMQAFVGVSGDNPWMNNAFAEVRRTDMGAFNNMDPGAMMSLVFGGIAFIVLLIGGIGVLNIAMVTIKQRVREIGIRRSFGATSGRIFFSVMMESVVATLMAGVLGIIVSVILLRNEYLLTQVMQMQVQEMPAYPIEAALIALGATVVVGALSGLIPALYAVNAKVIDAIRY
ncbi:MAG: ABC transporter permease [Microbacteriaceae bacterium]